jgi:hypothetical protein
MVPSINLLVIAVLIAFGLFISIEIQPANADDSTGDGKKSCNDHHSGDAKCSHGDSTPFLLPFP